MPDLSKMQARLQATAATFLDEFSSVAARAVFFSRAARTTVPPFDEASYLGVSPRRLFPEPVADHPWVNRIARERDGLRYRELIFASRHVPLSARVREAHKTAYGPNTLVRGTWLQHDDDNPKRPVAIFLHRWMLGGSRSIDDAVMLPWLARTLDIDILRIELPYHGQRTPKGARFDGEFFWSADLERTLEAIRQSVLDVRSIAKWITAQTGQDVGVIGQSLGGMMALSTACFEPNLKFCVSVAAHLDLAGVLEDASLLRSVRDDFRRNGWDSERIRDLMSRFGVADVSTAIPKENTLLIGGLYDRFLTPERIGELADSWDCEMRWYKGGHMGIYTHVRSYAQDIVRLLDRIAPDRRRS